jgi:hypothetical protein
MIAIILVTYSFLLIFGVEFNLNVIPTCFEELDHTRAAGIRDGQTRSRGLYLRYPTLIACNALFVRH